jgi:nitrate reductase alpha subunit
VCWCRCSTTSPAELSQTFDVLDWRKGCELTPGKTAPSIAVVERDYPATYERFTSLGPLLDKLGNGGKGITGTPRTRSTFSASLTTSSWTARPKVARASTAPLTPRK